MKSERGILSARTGRSSRTIHYLDLNLFFDKAENVRFNVTSICCADDRTAPRESQNNAAGGTVISFSSKDFFRPARDTAVSPARPTEPTHSSVFEEPQRTYTVRLHSWPRGLAGCLRSWLETRSRVTITALVIAHRPGLDVLPAVGQISCQDPFRTASTKHFHWIINREARDRDPEGNLRY